MTYLSPQTTPFHRLLRASMNTRSISTLPSSPINLSPKKRRNESVRLSSLDLEHWKERLRETKRVTSRKNGRTSHEFFSQINNAFKFLPRRTLGFHQEKRASQTGQGLDSAGPAGKQGKLVHPQNRFEETRRLALSLADEKNENRRSTESEAFEQRNGEKRPGHPR